jgi:rRNA processing protein Krr1/Pno1
MDRVQESIDVPGHLHGYLIGSQGVRIQEFQKKCHVTVALDRALNQAVVRGTKKNVHQAIDELRQVYFLVSDRSTAHLQGLDSQP